MAVLPLPLFPRTSKCSLERSCYVRISRRADVSAPPPVCSSKHNTQLLLSFMSSHPSVLSLLVWVTDMHAQRDTHLSQLPSSAVVPHTHPLTHVPCVHIPNSAHTADPILAHSITWYCIVEMGRDTEAPPCLGTRGT